MKFFLTLVIAILLSLLLSTLIYLTPAGNQLTHFIVFALFLGYVFRYGIKKNGEYENSVGTIFGIPTSWVIPAGTSFWIPTPIGGEVARQSTQKKVMDRSAKSGNSFPQVKTRDGGIVEVGAVKTWHVADAVKTARFSESELEKQVQSLFDRGIRLFSLYWDTDESHDDKDNTALADRKVDFSRYLQGAKDVLDRDGHSIPNDTAEKAFSIGIKIDNVDVVDVNEPKAVQDARNQAAAENAEAEGEKRDVNSIRERTLELMWDTCDEKEIAAKIAAKIEPHVTFEVALRTVRTARGDMEDINVSGDADGFTKGAVVQRKGPKK